MKKVTGTFLEATFCAQSRLLSMGRGLRKIFPGLPHHVVQRGVRKKRIFFNDIDRRYYLKIFREGCQKWKVKVLAYCLMKNHVHHILVPENKDSFPLLFGTAHSKYAKNINRMHEWKGHLWESRYFSSPLDSEYLYNAVRYVELNPKRAGIVENAEEYEWSSTRARIADRSYGLLDLENKWNKQLPTKRSWNAYLSNLSDHDEEKFVILRKHTTQNIPCGSDKFVTKLERKAGCSLRYRGRGRPRKDKI